MLEMLQANDILIEAGRERYLLWVVSWLTLHNDVTGTLCVVGCFLACIAR
jgi:hypothetical protein